jgi:hypothetical protein
MCGLLVATQYRDHDHHTHRESTDHDRIDIRTTDH